MGDKSNWWRGRYSMGSGDRLIGSEGMGMGMGRGVEYGRKIQDSHCVKDCVFRR